MMIPVSAQAFVTSIRGGYQPLEGSIPASSPEVAALPGRAPPERPLGVAMLPEPLICMPRIRRVEKRQPIGLEATSRPVRGIAQLES